ncbi:xylulokinase [Pseudoxanthobacter sp.]|uniref:xylulokinase n=1 Tax=Pseudoxanthobacter sp. TaxID=1925742 RepID=UPI002FE1EB2A
MACYLGLDLGTSALKAVLTDGAGQPVAAAGAALTTRHPGPGMAEQDPEDWWQALLAVMAQLRRADAAAVAAIRAIGLSGQMHGACLAGPEGTALRPALLWNDGRGTAEAAVLAARVPAAESIAGAKPSAGLMAPKLMWLAARDPARFAQARYLLAPKDLLRLRLTGEALTDPCDASGTLLFDQARRAWSPQLTAAAGIDPRRLPAIVEGNAPAGRLKPALAAAFGIAAPPGGVLVAGGAGDGAAGAIGLGLVRPGEGFLSLGTSAQISVALDHYAPAPGRGLQTFAHGLPGRWYRAAALMNGAGVLAWAATVAGLSGPAEALALVEAGYTGPGQLLFLPYLSGERTPLENPAARGVLFGLDTATDRRAMLQAVVEGITLALADGFAALQAAGPVPAALSVVGGGAAGDFWCRLIAAALGCPLRRHAGDAAAGPALGAARLAIMAATGAGEAELCRPAPVTATFAPDPALAAAFAAAQRRYRALYAAVKTEFSAENEG